ncbi:MAG: hypothetical protein M9961_02655 [Ilumatobacteraceae bacterium]|nr:hypothetical protein [Ilumatobacteraceae bacterium]
MHVQAMVLVTLLAAAAAALFVGWTVGRRRGIASLGSPDWVVQQAGAPPALANDPALVAYSRRVRRWRVAGALGGVAGAVVWLRSAPAGSRSVNLYVALFIGWFAAGILPELFVRHRPPVPQRVADLQPRRPLRFVTSSARRWWLASVLTTVGALLLGAAPTSPGPVHHDRLTVLVWMAVLAAVAVAAIVRITTRPQPAGTNVDIEVDRIIRQAATTRAMSGWIVLQFIGSWYLVPTRQLHGGWSVGATVVGVVATVGVLAGWAWMPTRMTRSGVPT